MGGGALKQIAGGQKEGGGAWKKKNEINLQCQTIKKNTHNCHISRKTYAFLHFSSALGNT